MTETVTPAAGVLVVGMHRSGTSAVAGALAQLGLAVCAKDDLIRLRSGNAKGHWESRSLVRFNDRLLRSLGGTWSAPPEPEVLNRSPQVLADELPLARRLFGQVHPPTGWVWKDPRNCLLLPFWTAALEVQMATVLVLRNPLEVARSLQRRDRLGGSQTLALWERYLRTALANLAGAPVFVTDYRAVVADTASWIDSTIGFLAARGIAVRKRGEEVAEFIDRDLKHHSADDPALDADGRVSGAQRELWRHAMALIGAHGTFPAIDLPEETPTNGRVLAAARARNGDRPSQAFETIKEKTMLETSVDERFDLSRDWARWLAKNRMLGMGDAQLIEVMVDQGVPEAVAVIEIDRLRADPCFEAGRWVAARLRKLESILAIQESLKDVAPSSRAIERRRNVSAAEFLTNYYAENRPLILLGFGDSWPARHWTAESLRQTLGDEPVEVMSGRDGDDRYEINAELHRLTMPFSDYVDRVQSSGASNDVYLVANNNLLATPAAAPMFDDFDAGMPPLDGSKSCGHSFLWFGPAGTVTPLHHDVMNVLFVQLHGRKRFTLISPSLTPRVYNEIGVFGDADPEHPDYHQHPLFRGVPTTDVVLEPGDTMFLPVGWWHRVESLDVSISLSFTNFAYPNEFRWQHPDG